MKKLFTLAALFICVLSAVAQEADKWSLKPYGFIRNDFYYNSRQNFDSAAGLFYLIPKDENLNAYGDDLNAASQSKMLSVATRIGVNIMGVPVLGAKTSARIETDFGGFSSSATMLRIRQAWCKLDWDTWAVTAGQTWHPMFGDVVPTQAGLNTGSPFQPFNSSPQMRVDYRTGDFRISASAIWQLQYNSYGPSGSTNDYITNGCVPELYLGAAYKHGGLVVDAGIDFLHMAPRTSTTDASGVTVLVDEYVNALSFMASARYRKGALEVSAKTILGENNSNLLMISGFGATRQNSDGSYDYKPLRNSTSWFNVVYGKKWQVGLFLGYMKNLGTSDALLSSATTYVFGPSNNIDNLTRIAPLVQYNIRPFLFTLEYERTSAAYGTLNLKNGKVTDTHTVSNNRISFITMYYF